SLKSSLVTKETKHGLNSSTRVLFNF
ncbi:hypothetical protein Zm00014a_040102, partial [Zea mays]